jgi:Na+-driven multidrug efflux pump
VREILAPGCLQEAFRGDEMKRFFTVNKDLFVRSLCLIAVYLGYSAISARFGDVPLAMCAVMMKLLMIFSYFTDGFAYAGEALTGKSIGRKDAAGVRATVKWTFVWSLGIGALFVGIYAFGGLPMFRIMTSDVQVVDASRPFLPWLILMPLAGCPAFTWDGIYIGATATRAMRNANIGCAVAFFAVWFIGLWLLSPEGNGLVHLLFAAYFAHLFYRSLYQTIRYRREVLTQLS